MSNRDLKPTDVRRPDTRPAKVGRADLDDRLGVLLTPLSLRGIPLWVIYLLSLLSLIYILNPTAGIIELLPDNLPIIGNLDEGVAFAMLWYGLVELFEGPTYRER